MYTKKLLKRIIRTKKNVLDLNKNQIARNTKDETRVWRIKL